MKILGDSWYAEELGLPTIEVEALPRWLTARLDHAVIRAAALWWCARRYDRLVVVGSGTIFKVVMVLERFFPRRRRYVVLLQFIPVPERSRSKPGRRAGPRRIARRIFHALVVAPVMRSAVERAHTLSSWEVQRNAVSYRVPRDRFVFIPFPLTLATDHDLPPLDGRGRRVLASGRAMCDWPTVFAAARGQEWDLEIVCSAGDLPEVQSLNADGRARVRCEIPLEEYREMVPQAAVYVLALREAEVSSGHIRVYDAVRSGTPVVAADVRGLTDYVRKEETALAFSPGDFDAAREAVNRILDDRALAERLRRAAFVFGRTRTRDEYLKKIRELIESAEQ